MSKKVVTCTCYQEQRGKTNYKTNMAIRINRNKKVPYQCEKDLWWSHNHSVDCFHLTSSYPLLPATRDKFCTYFEEGLSASEAFHHHETQLMKDPVTPMLLADHKYVVLYVVLTICTRNG